MTRALCMLALTGPAWLPVAVAALEPGDPAPPVHAARWWNGPPAPPLSGPRDTVDVVGFWATWSAPARDGLAALAGLQSRHGRDVVRVLALADEPAEDIAEYLEAHPRPGLTVAADDAGRSTVAWLGGAGETALPHAFVVDRSGVVAWHGHPGNLDGVVEAVLDGSWIIQPPEPVATTQPTAEPAAPPSDDEGDAAAAGGDDAAVDVEPEAPPTVLELRRMLGWAVQAGEWPQAVALIDEMIAQLGDNAEVPDLLSSKFVFQYEMMKSYGDAERTARELLALERDDAGALNTLAWTLLARGDFESLDHRWPDIAHEAARRALEASDSGSAGIIDTYARSLYLLGHIETAVDWQQRAVDAARDLLEQARRDGADERFLERVEANLEDLRTTLAYYASIRAYRAGTEQ